MGLDDCRNPLRAMPDTAFLRDEPILGSSNVSLLTRGTESRVILHGSPADACDNPSHADLETVAAPEPADG